MIVPIVGCGRSGTNLTLEMMRGHSYFNASELVEDKDFFLRDCYYKSGYLTKVDTVYCRSYMFFHKVMEYNNHVKVLWTIRHPYDMALSKVYRGFEGGSDDATFEGCISDTYHSWDLYRRAKVHFPNDVYLVRMEDTIKDIEKQAKDICDWLGLEYEEDMKYPHKRMRDKKKKERYKEIDNTQIDMYKDWKNLYDGYFVKNNIQMDKLFEMLKPMAKFFKYEG